MKYISHRGNLDGRNLKTENSPNQIDTVLSLGYDVEIDLRFLNKKSIHVHIKSIRKF